MLGAGPAHRMLSSGLRKSSNRFVLLAFALKESTGQAFTAELLACCELQPSQFEFSRDNSVRAMLDWLVST